MEKSLINPNQFISVDIKTFDEPTYPNIDMGFVTDNAFIPLSMYGSTEMMTTRNPKDGNLDTCP